MTTMSTGGGNGAVTPSVPVMMATWPYPDVASTGEIARDLRDRMDRMMAAMLGNCDFMNTDLGTLAAVALAAIQAVDDALYDEGVECE